MQIFRGEDRSVPINVLKKQCDDDVCGKPVDFTGAEFAVYFPGTIGFVIRRSSGFTIDFQPSSVVTASSLITLVGHGLSLNDIMMFSSTGTLPTGISGSTDYFAIPVDKDTFKISASKNGAAISISSQGTGVHTLIPDDQVTIDGNPILGSIIANLSEEATAALKLLTPTTKTQDVSTAYQIGGVLRIAKAVGLLTVLDK